MAIPESARDIHIQRLRYRFKGRPEPQLSGEWICRPFVGHAQFRGPRRSGQFQDVSRNRILHVLSGYLAGYPKTDSESRLAVGVLSTLHAKLPRALLQL